MRTIGLHLRLESTYTALIEKAMRLKLPIFQCFLVHQETKQLLPYGQEDVRSYLAIRRKHFKDVYVHGSYRINLAGIDNAGHYALRRELEIARMLECTHMIIHPGSARGFASKQEGIQVIADLLNTLLRDDLGIKIVLENAAHGSMAIGSNLQDFKLLRSLLEQPDKIFYCIDTAHAHSYGYPLHDDAGRNAFIEIIDNTIGIKNVVLLHLNDTHEKMGSKKDRHAMIGQGMMGNESLKAFMLHQRLKDIPVIMELPESDEIAEKNIIAMVNSWNEGSL